MGTPRVKAYRIGSAGESSAAGDSRQSIQGFNIHHRAGSSATAVTAERVTRKQVLQGFEVLHDGAFPWSFRCKAKIDADKLLRNILRRALRTAGLRRSDSTICEHADSANRMGSAKPEKAELSACSNGWYPLTLVRYAIND
jgi:hypothetical protein